MARFADAVYFLATSTGTVDFVVNSAITGFQTPASAAMVNGGVYKYRAESSDLTQWELGEGTWTSGTSTLSRTTVLFNNLGTTAKISFTAAPNVGIVQLKEDTLAVDEANAFTAAQRAQALSNISGVPAGSVNKFLNPGMDVDQRNTAAGVTVTTSGAYTTDGWFVTPTGASCTVTQQFNGANVGATRSFGSLQLKGAASVTGITLKQRIESNVLGPLDSRVVTIQCKVRNDTGGSITPTLTVKRCNAAPDGFGSLTTDLSAVSLQACANGATTQVAYTYTTVAGSYFGLEVTFDFGNNFSSTAKTVNVTDFDIRETPGVATGQNSTPPPVELRPIGVEMAACLRYFKSIYRNSVNVYTLSAVSSPTNLVDAIYRFDVPMRAAPTLITSATASDYLVSDANGGSSGACTSVPSLVGASQTDAFIRFTKTSHGLTNLAMSRHAAANANGILWLTAEL